MPKRKTEKRKKLAIDKFPIFYLEISHDALLFKLELFFFFSLPYSCIHPFVSNQTCYEIFQQMKEI